MEARVYRPLDMSMDRDPSLMLESYPPEYKEAVRTQILALASTGRTPIQLACRRPFSYQLPLAVQVRERGVAVACLSEPGGHPVQAKLELPARTGSAMISGVRLSLAAFVIEPHDRERLERYLRAEMVLRETALEFCNQGMPTLLSTGLGLHYDGPVKIAGGMSVVRQLADPGMEPMDHGFNLPRLVHHGPQRTRYESIAASLPITADRSYPAAVIGQFSTVELSQMAKLKDAGEVAVTLYTAAVPVKWLGHHDPDEHGAIIEAFAGTLTVLAFIEQPLSLPGAKEALKLLGYQVDEAPDPARNPLTAPLLDRCEIEAPWV